jgi:hypothetical protein
MTDVERGTEAAAVRAAFERGIQELLPSCEIRLTAKPAEPAPGHESLLFTVPLTGTSSPVLQATFEPAYELSKEEFRLLKAATAMAAVFIQYEDARALAVA